MLFCTNCGNSVSENAFVCPNCGCKINRQEVKPEGNTNTFGWGFLGFMVPIVGLILYISWKQDKPKKAKAAGLGALISACSSVVISIIEFVISLYISVI